MRQSLQVTIGMILLFLSTQIAAQTIVVNPKVGLHVSALDAKLQDFRTEARVGWNAGLDLRIGQGLIFLNPGIHYNSTTARLIKEVEFPEDVSFKDETTIRSLQLPVNIGLRLTGNDGLLGIHAKGGITPAYVLGVAEKPGFDFDADALNRFTLGANMGVGVDILFLTVDAVYQIGLTDYFEDAEGRNNVFTLSLGLKF